MGETNLLDKSIPLTIESFSPRYIKNVKELRVYREAFDISIEVHKETLNFPKIEQYAIADQMRRASKSICANLAEGFAKQAGSVLEFRRFVQMSAGSSAEMSVWT